MTDAMNKRAFEVSVVIPAYNAERFLQRALASVLAQTLCPAEIIVVDDGSKDRTAEVASQFGTAVRYLRQENTGVSAARNHGINAACQNWIAFLDADDWWEPCRLERGVDILRRHPELVWTAGRYTCMWPDGSCELAPPSTAFKRLLASDGTYFPSFFEAAVNGVPFHLNTILIAKQVLDEVGTFDPRMRSGEDLDLCYRVACRHPAIGYANESISVYERVSEGSLTRVDRSFSEEFRILLAKHAEPQTRPGLKGRNAREEYLRRWIRQAVRHAARLGEVKSLQRLLADYSAWLRPHERLLMRGIAASPSAVVKTMGQFWRRVIGTRRG